jgi:hypothetical protein
VLLLRSLRRPAPPGSAPPHWPGQAPLAAPQHTSRACVNGGAVVAASAATGSAAAPAAPTAARDCRHCRHRSRQMAGQSLAAGRARLRAARCHDAVREGRDAPRTSVGSKLLRGLGDQPSNLRESAGPVCLPSLRVAAEDFSNTAGMCELLLCDASGLSTSAISQPIRDSAFPRCGCRTGRAALQIISAK